MTSFALRAAMGAVVLAAGALPAAAVDIGGNYRVRGTNFDGSEYGGTAEIVVTSRNTCRITWDTGSTSEGICMRNANAFAAAYRMGDVVGIVIYHINDDGTLEGLWTIADQDGVGTETLIPR